MKYRSLDSYLKETFGCKVYKLSLSTGCTCPTRDGTKGTHGCTFCSQGGSGEFAAQPAPVGIQIEEAKKRVDRKFPKSVPAENRKYIAYFQSYTNTYLGAGMTIEKLRGIFLEAISRTEIAALSIATRPDCLPPEILELLAELNSIKPVWVEMGLQTVHRESAEKTGRAFSLAEFEESYYKLKAIGIEVIVHVILGLPGETKSGMKETVSYLASLSPPPDGVKLQLLHIIEGTQLAQEYREKPFRLFEMEEYCAFVAECLKLLPPQTVVHRITGDGPKKALIAPLWSADKKRVMNEMRKAIEKA